MNDRWPFRLIKCHAWAEFREAMRRDYAEEISGRYPIFRGHASHEWKLSSQWERRLAKLGDQGRRPDRARQMIEASLSTFKELSIGIPGVRSHDIDEIGWWAVGRHYGLVTPLLDWTRSSYVAAFFAFAGLAELLSPGATTTGDIDPLKFIMADSDLHVAIWALRVDEDIARDKHLRVLKPSVDIGHRQRAQRGLFTWLDHPDYLDVQSYLSTLPQPQDPYEREVGPLTKYVLAAKATARALSELRMMNITFSTLFPDLQGAALQANFEAASAALLVLSHMDDEAEESDT